MTRTEEICRVPGCVQKAGKLRNTLGESVCSAHWEAEFTSNDESVRRLREGYRGTRG